MRLHGFLSSFLLLACILLLQETCCLKVAFLLVGEFRSFVVTKYGITRHLLEAPVNQGHDVDVFVSTYDKTYPRDTESSPYALLAKEEFLSIAKEERALIKPYYTGKDMYNFVMDKKEFDEKSPYEAYVGEDKLEGVKACPQKHLGGGNGACSLKKSSHIVTVLMKFHEAMELVLREEEAKKRETGQDHYYDLIVKIRPDLMFLSDVSFTRMHDKLQGRKKDVLMHRCKRSGVGDDHVAWGSLAGMTQFASRKYLDYIGVKKSVPIPEYMQRQALGWMNVSYDYENDFSDYFLFRTLDIVKLYEAGSFEEEDVENYYHWRMIFLCAPRSKTWEVSAKVPPSSYEATCKEAERLSGPIMQSDFRFRHKFDSISKSKSCLGKGP